MVLHSVSDTQTPPASPPPPPIIDSSAFFVKPPSPFLHNFPFTNYRLSTNHPSFRTNKPVHYGMNPFLRFGSPSNRVENNNNSFWAESNSSGPRDSGLDPLQPFGPQPNQTNNNSYRLRDSDPVCRFGLQPNSIVNNNPNFNTNKPWDSSLNSVLHFGSSPNQIENTSSSGLVYSGLRLGSPVNHAENNNSSRMWDTSLNRALRFGSLPNETENNNYSSGLVDLKQSKHNHANFNTNDSGDSSLNPILHFGLPSNQVKNNNNNNNNDNDSTSLGDARIDESKSDGGVGKGIEKQGELNDTPEKKAKELAERLNHKILVPFSGKNKDSGDVSDAGVSEAEDEEADAEYSSEDVEPNFPFVKTWNLRPRKPMTKKPLNSHNNGPASRTQYRMVKTRARETAPKEKEKDKVVTPMKAAHKKPMISVSLMKEEIEEDFMRMTGDKPPKKLKKRARNVQKQLDVCFPGLRLNGVTRDIYRAVRNPPLKR